MSQREDAFFDDYLGTPEFRNSLYKVNLLTGLN